MAQAKIHLPQPTGSYNVGMKTYFLKDISRFYNNQNGRPLLVHIYYPSRETPKEYPPYLSDTMHLYKEKLLRTYNPKDLAYLDGIRDWAMPDAPMNTEDSPFPVLFFSPGFLMAAQLYSSLIEEMVSHGYVVVAINHTDACWPVMFPDGSCPIILPELADIFSNKERSCMQTFDMTQETWIKDVEFVLSWLPSQSITKSFDLSRMGIFGHSFGGSTAIESSRRYDAFRAVVNLDGLLFGCNWDKTFETPSLFVTAEKQLTHEDAISAGLTIEQCDSLTARNSKQVFDQLKNNSFYVTIKNADHATFVDSKIVKSPLFKNVFNPIRGIQITRALLVDFFDHYLKNKKMIILKEQNSEFTDILVDRK